MAALSEAIASEVREIRDLLGLNQEDFAKAIGVHRSTIVGLEGGNQVPHRGTVHAMVNLLRQRSKNAAADRLLHAYQRLRQEPGVLGALTVGELFNKYFEPATKWVMVFAPDLLETKRPLRSPNDRSSVHAKLSWFEQVDYDLAKHPDKRYYYFTNDATKAKFESIADASPNRNRMHVFIARDPKATQWLGLITSLVVVGREGSEREVYSCHLQEPARKALCFPRQYTKAIDTTLREVCKTFGFDPAITLGNAIDPGVEQSDASVPRAR